MKLNREDNPELFENIIDDMYEESYSNHRRGSNFFVQWIYKVDDPNLDPSYHGFWESNEFVWDSEYGYERSDIYELTKVEEQEIITKTTQWVAVKD